MSTATQEATFTNDSGNDCIVRLLPEDCVEVEWSCGDAYLFHREFIQNVVDFLKPDTPKFAGVMLRALRRERFSPESRVIHSEFDLSFAQLVDDGKFLHIAAFGVSLDWAEFCDAWKEITTTK